jgi:hypothetical protein
MVVVVALFDDDPVVGVGGVGVVADDHAPTLRGQTYARHKYRLMVAPTSRKPMRR